jgi:hypothetical protein
MADIECRRDFWNPNLKHELRFVASMSVCPSDIRKIRQHVEIAQASIDPLRSILVTPLFVGGESLKLVRQMAEEGRFVMFDSGGYYVQLGRLRYEELYMPLLNAYRANRWASVYTLPDHVPTSRDTPDVVERKVRDTIRFSTLFFQEMPDELKPRAMPVVQGHTYRQIEACLRAYLNLGVRYIGFGSFGTQGERNQVNIVTQNSLKLARHIISVAHAHGVRVHLFGLGAPPYAAMLKGIHADSFDSGSWLVAAGHGMVSLPFMRYYNISHRNEMSEFQRGILPNEFEHLKSLTGHRCALCDDLRSLQQKKMYRAVHNLIVMTETVNLANRDELNLIETIYAQGSVKYRSEFRTWLQTN